MGESDTELAQSCDCFIHITRCMFPRILWWCRNGFLYRSLSFGSGWFGFFRSQSDDFGLCGRHRSFWNFERGVPEDILPLLPLAAFLLRRYATAVLHELPIHHVSRRNDVRCDITWMPTGTRTFSFQSMHSAQMTTRHVQSFTLRIAYISLDSILKPIGNHFPWKYFSVQEPVSFCQMMARLHTDIFDDVVTELCIIIIALGWFARLKN